MSLSSSDVELSDAGAGVTPSLVEVKVSQPAPVKAAAADILPPNGAIHRHPDLGANDELWSRVPNYKDVGTTHEAFVNTVAERGTRQFIGSRQRRFDTSENGNVDNPYVFKTYQEVYELVGRFAAGLDKVEASTNIGIYSKNREEWVITSQACAGTSRTVVPLYDTLGQEVVEYCINLTEVDTVVAEGHLVKFVLHVVGHCATMKRIISMDEPLPADVEAAKAAKIDLIFFENFYDKTVAIPPAVPVSESKNGKKAKGEGWDWTPPDPEFPVTICFTSGTTGNPKGAVLSHRNLIADIAGADSVGFQIHDTDVHISYLPLAHVFERLVQIGLMVHGASFGFFRGDAKVLIQDIGALAPTVFCSVPRLLNKVYASITSKGYNACCCKAACFSSAVSTKISNLDKGVNTHGLWDALVFSKVKKTLGGRVRIVVTGSAPLGEEVMKFCRIAFGAIVLEGYGQTEGSAACTLTQPGDFSTGHVGVPLACVEIALADVPDMDYWAQDTVYEAKRTEWEKVPEVERKGFGPRLGGEICIRGPIVMSGYYRNPEKTAEAIDVQGWLHTGDIGRWLPAPEGSTTLRGDRLKIVDRKKNIFKLSHGEYVAPERIENILKVCPFIEQMWVYGNSLHNSIIAVVIPDELAAKKWHDGHGAGAAFSYAAMTDNDAFKSAILTEFKKMASAVDAKGQPTLKPYEVPAALHLETAIKWEPGSDLMTATFKVRRPELQLKYQTFIDAMYVRLVEAEQAKENAGAASTSTIKSK